MARGSGRTIWPIGTARNSSACAARRAVISTGRWIIVGTDFSEGSDSALAQALALASALNASIALVHAYEDPPGGGSTDDHLPDLLRRDLREAVDRSIARERGIHVEPLIRRGAPWDKLVNAASDLGAPMIVVGAYGQRGPSRGAFVGSVAMRVVASSTQSVLVVRGGSELG